MSFGPRVFAARLERVRMHDHQRQLRRGTSRPGLRPRSSVDRAAVHLDDVTHDRQAQAEAAGLARHAGLGLAEPLEDERQEVWRMPMPVSLTTISTCESTPLEPDLDATALSA